MDNNIEVNELPVLVIFTYGLFDKRLDLSSRYEMDVNEYISKMWKEAGYNILPKIIYWDLSDKKKEAICRVDLSNVMIMKGRAERNFKMLMYGESIKSNNLTPWNSLVKILESDMYNIIRSKFS